MAHQCGDLQTMAGKKTQKQRQETTLVPHRTPNLSVLLERAKDGDSADAVKAYLDAGGSSKALVHGKGGIAKWQIPLLHYMALYNLHPHKELAECVSLMVAAGADINTLSGPGGRTALMSASVASCCTQTLQILLQNGADVLASAAHGSTALHLAAAAGRIHHCELLLVKNSDLVHIRNADGWTALMPAVAVRSVDTVKVLRRHGADMSTVDKGGAPALFIACQYKRVSMAAFLIEAGADVNAANKKGHTPLMAAVETNSAPLVRLLLNHGADMNNTESKSQSLLFRAAFYGHMHMLELLVQHGLSVTAIDSEGHTPLVYAALNGQKVATEWLLNHGVAVNAVGYHGCTALHTASGSKSCDDSAIIELLLANGADVHARGKLQQTALDMAASQGNTECANVLIAAGADVNSADSYGVTSLHIAINTYHKAVVQLLLEHGATAVMNDVIPVRCAERFGHCCKGMTALMACTTVDTAKNATSCWC
jgi:uncharacterized protein